MSAPLRTGAALARQRIAGLVFLVVIALLVASTVALYQKTFTPVDKVTLKTNSIGNQMSIHADVKVRGVLVGEVKKISSDGTDASLVLALNPADMNLIPANVAAELLPKTLFGEKFVDLVIPNEPSPQRLRAGDVIHQDDSHTAVETETAVNNLLPLLKSLDPQDLSLALNALSTALRGRGNELGGSLARTGKYLQQLNPSLPTLQKDMQGLADFANNTADATPHLLEVLDNLSASSRYLVEEKGALNTFLTSTTGFASTAQSIIAQNQKNLISLSATSIPVLQLYAKYSSGYPCLFKALTYLEKPIAASFGGKQAGLHITLELTKDNGGYTSSMYPKYGDTGGITCYGLDPAHPIIPVTLYYNPYDGYYDGEAVDPYTGKPPCTHTPCAEPPKGGDEPNTAAAIDLAAARMNIAPSAVSGLAVELLAPALSGTTASIS